MAINVAKLNKLRNEIANLKQQLSSLQCQRDMPSYALFLKMHLSHVPNGPYPKENIPIILYIIIFKPS